MPWDPCENHIHLELRPSTNQDIWKEVAFFGGPHINLLPSQPNTDDNRDSITINRSGLAFGAEGPHMFLIKAKKVDNDCFKNFAKKHNAPSGSMVITTPNAYMTDESWVEMAKDLCVGLQKTPLLSKYPGLWMVLTLDGYGSHKDPKALEVFAEHKILVFKEEADTSQVCQAYDKEFSKDDKRHHLNFLDGIWFHSPMVGQMGIVLVANAAQNKVQPRQWRDSHDCVNLRPSTRTPFAFWIERVQAAVQTGELFFKKIMRHL